MERKVPMSVFMVRECRGHCPPASLAKPATTALQFVGKNAEPIYQGVSAKLSQMFAANPLQQVSSAAGAGLAGGASKEAGGSPLMQGAASLVGGVVGCGKRFKRQGWLAGRQGVRHKGLDRLAQRGGGDVGASAAHRMKEFFNKGFSY